MYVCMYVCMYTAVVVSPECSQKHVASTKIIMRGRVSYSLYYSIKAVCDPYYTNRFSFYIIIILPLLKVMYSKNSSYCVFKLVIQGLDCM